MNRVYKLKYNVKLCELIVVSELADNTIATQNSTSSLQTTTNASFLETTRQTQLGNLIADLSSLYCWSKTVFAEIYARNFVLAQQLAGLLNLGLESISSQAVECGKDPLQLIPTNVNKLANLNSQVANNLATFRVLLDLYYRQALTQVSSVYKSNFQDWQVTNSQPARTTSTTLVTKATQTATSLTSEVLETTAKTTAKENSLADLASWYSFEKNNNLLEATKLATSLVANSISSVNLLSSTSSVSINPAISVNPSSTSSIASTVNIATVSTETVSTASSVKPASPPPPKKKTRHLKNL